MKKFKVILCGLVLMFATTTQLTAAQCTGGSVVWFDGAAELAALIVSAAENCCAGSSINAYDLDTRQLVIIDVLVDGPNSSCAQE